MTGRLPAAVSSRQVAKKEVNAVGAFLRSALGTNTESKESKTLPFVKSALASSAARISCKNFLVAWRAFSVVKRPFPGQGRSARFPSLVTRGELRGANRLSRDGRNYPFRRPDYVPLSETLVGRLTHSRRVALCIYSAAKLEGSGWMGTGVGHNGTPPTAPCVTSASSKRKNGKVRAFSRCRQSTGKQHSVKWHAYRDCT